MSHTCSPCLKRKRPPIKSPPPERRRGSILLLDDPLQVVVGPWQTSEPLLKVKLFSLLIMVYKEAQKVKVLRINQKNAKGLRAELHGLPGTRKKSLRWGLRMALGRNPIYYGVL